MFKGLKKIIGLFVIHKRKVFLFWSLCSIFFILIFPWSQMTEKLVKNAQKDMPFKVQFSNLKLKWIPPSVELQDFALDKKILNNDFELDHLSVSIVFTDWLALKPTWKIQMKEGDSSLVVTVLKQAIQKEDQPEEQPEDQWNIESNSSFISLSLLKSFFPDLNLLGQISYDLKFKGSISDVANSAGVLNVKGSNVQSFATQLKTNLGNLSLPFIKWSDVKISLQLKESGIIIDMSLGSQSDKLYIRLRGNVGLKIGYGNSVGIDNYDLQTQIEVSPDEPISLLDLFLSKVKTTTKDAIIYKARIRGNSYGIPKVEPLQEF